jgi:SMODS and SLOG-associating 2TM effector domain 1/Transposase/Protein of unknown function (DUF4231)
MDVSKRDAKVCVRVAGRGRRKTVETVRTWSSKTNAVLALREHLINEQVTLVVMEATGDYWKQFYHLLDDADFEVMLVNARQVKNLPGRKSDVSDAGWLAQGSGVAENDVVASANFVEELWRVQSSWSQVANQMKKRIERTRTFALILVIAVALLGASAAALASSSATLSRVFAAAAALGAGLLPLLQASWSGKALRDWTTARSLAEALKSNIYLWLARAGAYGGDQDASLLRMTTDEIRASGADLLKHHLRITPQVRQLPDVYDARSYFAARVVGQVEGFYRPTANRLASRVVRLRRIQTFIALAGAGLGALAAGLRLNLASWIAVVTTIGTALAVHVAATRYDYQTLEFLRTADRLSRLTEEADATSSASELDALILQAEEAILTENKGWMAKFTEGPPIQPIAGGS